MKDKSPPDLTADREKFDAILKRFAAMKPLPLEQAIRNRKTPKPKVSAPKTSKD